VSSQDEYQYNEQLETSADYADEIDDSLPPKITASQVASIDEMSPDDLEVFIGDIDANEDWEGLKETARDRANVFLKLKLAQQAPRCAHMKTNGSKCGSPAVTGDMYCYFHGDARARRKALEETKTFDMPLLEDKLSIQMAVMHVCGLLAQRSIDEKTARVMFCGLRIAQRNIETASPLEDI
jgi:sulfite reductase alpha subunit-like flavoprotein